MDISTNILIIQVGFQVVAAFSRNYLNKMMEAVSLSFSRQPRELPYDKDLEGDSLTNSITNVGRPAKVVG